MLVELLVLDLNFLNCLLLLTENKDLSGIWILIFTMVQGDFWYDSERGYGLLKFSDSFDTSVFCAGVTCAFWIGITTARIIQQKMIASKKGPRIEVEYFGYQISIPQKAFESFQECY